jgi:hypothetical protein
MDLPNSSQGLLAAYLVLLQLLALLFTQVPQLTCLQHSLLLQGINKAS